MISPKLKGFLSGLAWYSVSSSIDEILWISSIYLRIGSMPSLFLSFQSRTRLSKVLRTCALAPVRLSSLRTSLYLFCIKLDASSAGLQTSSSSNWRDVIVFWLAAAAKSSWSLITSSAFTLPFKSESTHLPCPGSSARLLPTSAFPQAASWTIMANASITEIYFLIRLLPNHFLNV